MLSIPTQNHRSFRNHFVDVKTRLQTCFCVEHTTLHRGWESAKLEESAKLIVGWYSMVFHDIPPYPASNPMSGCILRPKPRRRVPWSTRVDPPTPSGLECCIWSSLRVGLSTGAGTLIRPHILHSTNIGRKQSTRFKGNPTSTKGIHKLVMSCVARLATM